MKRGAALSLTLCVGVHSYPVPQDVVIAAKALGGFVGIPLPMREALCKKLYPNFGEHTF